MSAAEPVVLVGTSTRYLAQSAQRAGYVVLAADAFGDTETRMACSVMNRSVGTQPQALLAACEQLDVDEATPWMYGSGFEPAPRLLADRTRRCRNLLGNSAAVLSLISAPLRFFDLLVALDIDFPETAFQRPSEVDGWLFKQAACSGGYGVSLARDADAALGEGYYQRFMKGPLCSLLFCADGSDAQVIGFNRLMASYPAAGDFRFAGAISGLAVTPAQQAQMVCAARRLTRALGLKGVNGLDFVMHKGMPLLLELNARPTATLELYETALSDGGASCHLEACRGHLHDRPGTSEVHGMRVFYANEPFLLGEIPWPSWVKDRPASGERLAAGEPLCTVHAQGANVESVAAELRERMDQVRYLVKVQSEDAA